MGFVHPLTLQGHPLERYNIPKVQEFTNIFQNHTADYIASPTDSHSFDLLLVLLWESERHQCCCFVVLFSWCINKNLLANAWCLEKGCIIVFATRKLCALLAFICLKLRSNRNQPLNHQICSQHHQRLSVSKTPSITKASPKHHQAHSHHHHGGDPIVLPQQPTGLLFRNVCPSLRVPMCEMQPDLCGALVVRAPDVAGWAGRVVRVGR